MRDETRDEGRSYEVKPAAHSGFEEGYLSSMKITYDDSPAGMGPTGMAIKTKCQEWCMICKQTRHTSHGESRQ